MGMYDQLNSITRAINESKKTEELKTTRTTAEQLIKYNILSLLQEELREAEQNGFNLYHAATQDRIITNIIKLIQDKSHNELKYLHNKEYTIYFIKDNYFKELAKLQKIQKEASKPAIEQEKIRIKEEKEQKKIKKRQKQEKIKSTIKGLTIILIILLAPIIIIGGFLLACAKAVK